MSNYLDESGVCFAPWCKIKLIHGGYKRLDELNGNELLWINNSI
jgi:hypothetical protein